MGRFGASDFGYTFVSTTEEEVKVEESGGGGGDEGIEEIEQQVTKDEGEEVKAKAAVKDDSKKADARDDYKYKPAKRYRGGESLVASSGAGANNNNASIGFPTCLGATCCCLTACLVIAGGILLVVANYEDDTEDDNGDDDDDDELVLAGSILLVLAAGFCLCGCCLVCIGTIFDALNPPNAGGGSGGDPLHKEIKLRMRRLNDRYEKGCLKAEQHLRSVRLDVVGHMKEVKEAAQKEVKAKRDDEKKQRQELERRVKQDLAAGLDTKAIRQKYRPVAFYIVFHGDTMVSNLELLRKQVSLVVNLANPGVDQCVVSLTSPGGAVSAYGLAASQLVRLRKAGIRLTVCVDTVAASGGYMMASVADYITAAPFAMVGSIGVVTQIPNIQRFLESHDIDAYLVTAGKHKRTIDIIGHVTEENKAKLREELNDIHDAFKDHVALSRPALLDSGDTAGSSSSSTKMDEEIGTGEHWLAVQAKEKGLVDAIMTSDEYLESLSEEYDIIEILEKKQRRSAWSQFQAADATKSVVKAAAQALLETTSEQGKTPAQSPTPMAIV